MAARKPTVLVVEDDDGIREAVHDVLDREGYPVATASNGAQALDYLRHQHPRPCVVLLDLMMPVMDGWQLLEHLRSETPDVPVVAMTAASQFRIPDDVPIVRKPITRRALLDTIRATCR